MQRTSRVMNVDIALDTYGPTPCIHEEIKIGTIQIRMARHKEDTQIRDTFQIYKFINTQIIQTSGISVPVIAYAYNVLSV